MFKLEKRFMRSGSGVGCEVAVGLNLGCCFLCVGSMNVLGSEDAMLRLWVVRCAIW